ncbi:MAG: single-stranded DNA-binding protein, partial [Dolichospermum sp.]|nr:single-stranded DNA-binding protein [Dolichospermum sp.]
QTGVNRSNPIIHVEQLELLGSKRDGEGGGADMSPDNF